MLTGTEVAFEARNVNAIANFVWEDAGLSSDPGVPLRIAANYGNSSSNCCGWRHNNASDLFSLIIEKKLKEAAERE